MVLNLITAALFSMLNLQDTDTTVLKLNDNRFQYRLEQDISGSRDSYLAIQQNDKLVQRIPISQLAAQQPVSGVRLQDVNFDGKADLMILSGRGNVNSTYDYWLYNAQAKKFIINQLLSNSLAGYEIKFDSTRHFITTAIRKGCCKHVWNTYHLQGEKLKLIKTKIGN